MSWAKRTAPIKVGDTVAYTRQFLQSIGCYTGNMPHGRGKVTALVPVGPVTIAHIEWDLPDLPERVNVKNLCRANEIAFDP